VVTDVGDSAWIVNATGRVTRPRNAQALAAACEELLDVGPTGRKTLGQAARNRVIELFSLPTVVAEYEVLYESMIASPATSKKRSDRTYRSVAKVYSDERVDGLLQNPDELG